MKTLLIIDDEEATLAMLKLFLEASGYRVLVAGNAGSGLDIFEKELPPVVITDIKMPGKDGFSVLKQIKSAAPDTKVIVVTGHGDEDLEKQAFSLEASDFIHKPLDPNMLLKVLERFEEG